jgi:hypothetical protein
MDEQATPAGVSQDEIAIALRVHRASDPIAGTITLPHAPPVPFTGWMQLTQLLGRALDAAR